MLRDVLSAIIAFGTAAAQAESAVPAGETIYRANCAHCHDQGVNGAPRIGDRKAWRARIAEGKRMQVRMAIKGIRKMPPRGGNPKLTDEEMEHAVVYLLNRSGGKFEE